MACDETVETIRGYRYIRLKSGRLITFWDAIRDAESGHADLRRALSRAFKLADGEYDLESVELRLDRMQEHLDVLRAYMEKLRGVQSKRERIALLRNVEGRTPEEAAGFLRKADELEHGIGNEGR